MGGFPSWELIGVVKSGQIERRVINSGVRGNPLIRLSERDAVTAPVTSAVPRATTFHYKINMR